MHKQPTTDISATTLSTKSGSGVLSFVLLTSLLSGTLYLAAMPPLAPYKDVRARSLDLQAFGIAKTAQTRPLERLLPHAAPAVVGEKGGKVPEKDALDTLKARMAEMQAANEHRQALRLLMAQHAQGNLPQDDAALEVMMQRAGYDRAAIQRVLAARARGAKNPFETEAAQAGDEDDTMVFAGELAKDVVKEEVNSFISRLLLLGRIGNFVMRKAGKALNDEKSPPLKEKTVGGVRY